MDADKIQQSIKEASKELFRKYGYHKTSVNEIAKKSRVAKGIRTNHSRTAAMARDARHYSKLSVYRSGSPQQLPLVKSSVVVTSIGKRIRRPP